MKERIIYRTINDIKSAPTGIDWSMIRAIRHDRQIKKDRARSHTKNNVMPMIEETELAHQCALMR